jgi:hypothetical protein
MSSTFFGYSGMPPPEAKNSTKNRKAPKSRGLSRTNQAPSTGLQPQLPNILLHIRRGFVERGLLICIELDLNDLLHTVLS